MGLRLNLWRAGNGFIRIYLNGLPVEGKAWLQASRGRTAVHADGIDGAEVLKLVGEAAGCDPSDWDVLAASVEAMPAPRRHACEGLGYDLGLRGAGPKDPGHAAAYVMEGIPGVSAVTAKLLHARFGSLAGLAAAGYEDLLGVPGIGPKRARAIHDTMNARPPG